MKTIMPGSGVFKIELKEGAASVQVKELLSNKNACLISLFVEGPLNPDSEAWVKIYARGLLLFAGYAVLWTSPWILDVPGVIGGIPVDETVEIELRGFEQESVQLGLQWIEERDGE